jgi:carboxypeptidase Q
VPIGFERGPNQSVKMLAPWKADMVFTTPAWTPGTNGKQTITPILEPETMEEFNALGDKLRGAYIVMRRQSGLRGPQGTPSDVEKALADAPIAGRIYGTPDERVHTGGRFTGLTMESLPKQSEIRVRKSDFDTLMLALKAGRDVTLELNIDNRFIQGPVPQYNIIADLPGSEKPDEMVIVCGHFDSWNGPGSVGANDNGTGSTVAFEAARLLAKTGAKPKRTIRFIWWSGEEQGLLGSRAYVQMHKDEMDKISAVFNDDGGTNYQGGYQCLETMVPMLKAAMSPIEAAFPDMPMRLDVVAEMPRGGSSDHAPFNMVGVPGFYSIEAGKADYGFVWHTQNDRPEFSVPEYLTQSSTNAAVVALNVACANTLLPRGPKPEGGVGLTVNAPAGGSRNYYHDHSHDDDDHNHDDEYVDYIVDSVLRYFGLLGK